MRHSMFARSNARVAIVGLMVLVAVALVPVCDAVGVRDAGSLAAGLKRYEVSTPFDVDVGGSTVRHPPAFAMTVRAFGVDHRVEVERHDTLLADGYHEADASTKMRYTHGEHNDKFIDGGHCHYRGRLVGDADSIVALSLCDGVRAEIISLSLEGGSLSVEPAHVHVGDVAKPTARGRSFTAEEGVHPTQAHVLAFRRTESRNDDAFTNPFLDDVRRGVEAKVFNSTGGGVLKAQMVGADGEAKEYGGEASLSEPDTESLSSFPGEATETPEETPVSTRARRSLKQLSAENLYIELIVVNDRARVEQYSTLDEMHDESIHVVNVVSAIYEAAPFTPGVRVVLLAQYDFASEPEPWYTTVDTYTTSGRVEKDGDGMLDAFATWRSGEYDDLPPHDTAHLFSGEDLFASNADGSISSDVVGLANQRGTWNMSICEIRDICGSVVPSKGENVVIGENQCYGPSGGPLDCCYPLASVALSQVHKAFLAFDSETVAHEIGHQLGFAHDGKGDEYGSEYDEGTGDCPESGHVMAWLFEYGVETNGFSECSVRNFDKRVLANQFQCLTVGTTAVCGNGVVEGDEECDCPNRECDTKDLCCDGATCRLKANAVCSAIEGDEGCCDPSTCAARASMATCRQSTGECDLADTCDGTSFTCPTDEHVPVGVSCGGADTAGDMGACWQGRCMNRNESCYDISSTVFSEGGFYGGASASSTCGNGADLHVFSADSCETTAGVTCFADDQVCSSYPVYSLKSTSSGRTYGALPGMPCSPAQSREVPYPNGTNVTVIVHPNICDGGSKGNGEGSACVPMETMIPALPPPPAPSPPPRPPYPPPSPPPSGPSSSGSGFFGAAQGRLTGVGPLFAALVAVAAAVA